MKKFICILLLVSMFLMAFSACSGNDKVSINGKVNDKNISLTPEDSSSDENDENENETMNEDSSVYGKYSNLSEIGKFHNGLAPFVVIDSEGRAYGYIDILGNVVIEANYSVKNSYGKVLNVSVFNLPSFEQHNYIGTLCEDKVEHIIDKNGVIQFSIGENNVTKIGYPSNGYFWIETSKEELTGYVYTVTYYSAKDMTKIVSFENKEGDKYYRYESDSDVKKDGTATLVYGPTGWGGSRDRFTFNISEYDPNFKTHEETDKWDAEIDEIEAFQGIDCYYYISKNYNSIGKIASVVLKNKDNIYYYATVDQAGNVLMQPQKNISFGTISNQYFYDLSQFEFCKDLCPAQDTESGLWGYIDPYGNWKIQPQFDKAMPFSTDGYATVNSKTVIDTTGSIILAPQTIKAEDIYGSYSYSNRELSLFKDGTIKVIEYVSGGSFSDSGTYEIKGGNLIVSGIGLSTIWAINPFQSNQDGEHPIQKEGNALIINGRKWTKIES